MTVVVDDSHSVWSQHRRNLVVVERYVYFPSSRLQLGINRPSLLEANRCELQTHGMPRSRVLHSCPRAACGWLAAGKRKSWTCAPCVCATGCHPEPWTKQPASSHFADVWQG